MKKRIKSIIKFLLVFIICSISSICSYACEGRKVINPHKLDTSSPISLEEYEVSKLVEKLFINFDLSYNYYNLDIHVDSKIIFNMLTYVSVEDSPLYSGTGGDYQYYYIGKIAFFEKGNKATVYVYMSNNIINNEYGSPSLFPLDALDLIPYNPLKVDCKKINGKWIIIDIGDTLETFKNFHKNYLFAFVRKINKNDKIYLYNRPSLDGKIIGEFSKNIGVVLKRFKYNDFYEYYCDLDNGLCDEFLYCDINKYLYDKHFDHPKLYIKACDVIILNSIKIKKGFNKELAYFLLGRPQQEKEENGGLTLYYSDKDYIKCDKDNNIISWSGFKEFKDYFE